MKEFFVQNKALVITTVCLLLIAAGLTVWYVMTNKKNTNEEKPAQ